MRFAPDHTFFTHPLGGGNENIVLTCAGARARQSATMMDLDASLKVDAKDEIKALS